MLLLAVIECAITRYLTEWSGTVILLAVIRCDRYLQLSEVSP